MNETRGLWRGKRKLFHNYETGQDVLEWAFGCLVRSSNKTMIFVFDEKTTQMSGTEVNPSTLGECTGIPDKNKKLIFEWDICTVATSNIADDEYGVVRFDENEAVFVIDFGTYTINFCNNVNGSSVEVIGNIHDNPELLKGADNENT